MVLLRTCPHSHSDRQLSHNRVQLWNTHCMDFLLQRWQCVQDSSQWSPGFLLGQHLYRIYKDFRYTHKNCPIRIRATFYINYLGLLKQHLIFSFRPSPVVLSVVIGIIATVMNSQKQDFQACSWPTLSFMQHSSILICDVFLQITMLVHSDSRGLL